MDELLGLDVTNVRSIEDVVDSVSGICGKRITVRPIEERTGPRAVTAYSEETADEVTIYAADRSRLYQVSCALNQVGYLLLRARAVALSGSTTPSNLAPIPTRDLNRYSSPDVTIDDRAAENFVTAVISHLLKDRDPVRSSV
ncbi:hypothetical protein [Leifsonia aquatica]|uniref:hypothetical protein n=1 Tax=Leifsonia aquatica TaxID=144185 RepID=UPI003822A4A7